MNSGALATDDEHCRHAESPELRLLAAVLERAVFDARAGRADAVAWLASDAVGVSGDGWSYLETCDALGLDPAFGRALAAQVQGRARRPATRFRRLEAA